MSNTLQTMPALVPGSDINSYIQAAHSVPVLTAEQEQDLADRLFYHDDLEAARQLVMSHLRFVIHVAKTYSGYGLPQADLIQEGNVGLMKAVKRFDPTRGVRLVSFAVHWIRAEMHEYILKNWRIVKIATTKAQRKLFFNLRSKKKSLGWMTNDEAKAVAEDLGVSLKDVHQMEGRLSNYDQGFDAGHDDTDESSWTAPAAYIEADNANPADLVEKQAESNSNLSALTLALKDLDARSMDIIQRRWLDDDNKATLHELAEEYGVSAERIRQIERNAMNKVKAAMTA